MVIQSGSSAGQSSTKKTMSKLAITQDDSKVLGRVDRKLDKVKASTEFSTNMFKTQNSAWTPVVHKPSNQQVFLERSELVSHWYDVWTDKQRKQFLDIILRGCQRSQLLFVQNWFQERVPLERLDFTTVLPKFLSMYIFSFLDPRSLCRASQVSWHWKFLAEQDDIWLPKCVKLGWFLPYQPTQREYGAWKNHYIACTLTLHMQGPSQEEVDMYGRIEAEKKELARRKNMLLRSNKLTGQQRDLMVSTRPPWVDTDQKPRDLELASKALLHELNPNTPRQDKTQSLFHDKFGINKGRLSKEKGGTRASLPASLSEYKDFGLESSSRRDGHRVLKSVDDLDLCRNGVASKSLTECTVLHNLEEKRMEELVNAPWQPPHKRITRRSDNMSGGMNYPLPWKYRDQPASGNAYSSQVHPRIVFISSRVPAADVLADAVMFGVIPILYEYEGTTLESLMSRLETTLAGRTARSVGIFGHQLKPGQMCLVHGQTLGLENLAEAEIMEFFIFLTERVMSREEGGHVDLFAPFGSCESGLEMIHQLEILTGSQFNAPTGVLGNYNHIDSEWLVPGEEQIPPPALYFVPSKTSVWANCADIVQEACHVTKRQLGTYFEEKHRDLVAQVTGQMVFDAMGELDVQGLHGVTPVVVDGLVNLAKNKTDKPLETLATYLIDRVGTIPADLEDTRQTRSHDKYEEDFEGSEEEEIEEDIDLDDEIKELTHSEKSDKPKAVKQRLNELQLKSSKPSTKSFPAPLASRTPRGLKLSTSTMSKRLTTEEFTNYPDKRRAVAREILASETDYCRSLESMFKVFVNPLNSAIKSNKPIISTASIQTIFSIPSQILEISRSVLSDLENKLSQWSPQQCLGDVFVKFCARLKVYTNYCNNYSVILATIDRCVEQHPGFRAFLKRHNRQPSTKMLTLEELLLLPTRRIADYCRLLAWFELHTPRDHADRVDLAQALVLLGDVTEFIDECKQRLEYDKELIRLQKTIVNCPSLLEANRFLIKHEDVAHLQAPETSTKVQSHLRVYQQIEMLGLFLFNDALVVTKRTSKHFPFERNVEYTYRFLYSLSLNKLRITDMPDTKFVQNAFRIATASRRFYVQAHSREAKINFISRLEGAIIAYVENK